MLAVVFAELPVTSANTFPLAFPGRRSRRRCVLRRTPHCKG